MNKETYNPSNTELNKLTKLNSSYWSDELIQIHSSSFSSSNHQHQTSKPVQPFDQSKFRQSGHSKNPSERGSSIDVHSNQSYHLNKSTKNPTHRGFSRDHHIQPKKTEEKQEQLAALSNFETDQKRYQDEMTRDDEEIENYQRKRKERRVEKKIKARRDSADEYFKRSLETVGDPTNRNRRFSLASDRSTLIPSSSTQIDTTKTELDNKTVSKTREKLNEIILNSENETVQAANVLLGLGLSTRPLLCLNTKNNSTSSTPSSTLHHSYPKPTSRSFD